MVIMKILEGRSSRSLWLGFMLLICVAWVSPVKSQSGFLSVDCGSNSNYTDDTGIPWVKDATYSKTVGTNVNILVKNDSGSPVNERQVATLRYFDTTRTRNCYSLPVQTGSTYLLRATFYFGNLSESSFGSFEVYVDHLNWLNLEWNTNTNRYFSNVHEMIYSVPKRFLDVCLARIEGPTFISALELRRLAPGMYSSVIGPGLTPYWLDTMYRVNCGPPETGPIQSWRFPDDSYDRIWHLFGTNDKFATMSNPNTPVSYFSYHEEDQPPLAVMQTAWYEPSYFAVTYDAVQINPGQGPGYNVYVAAYFQELDSNMSATNFRGINYSLNNQLTYVFSSLDPLEIYSTVMSSNSNLTVAVEQSNSSNFGPILNAYEIYALIPYTKNATNPQDVTNLGVLQTALNLSDWIGDPCLPRPFDWLSCNNDVSPRITALYLGHQGFGGSIPGEISFLTELTNLTLSNNSFTGSIPDWSSLTHLEVIYLQENDLRGDIPTFLGISLPNLTQLNLDNNNFSGAVPSNLNKPGLNFTVLNNPKCTIPGCGVYPPTNAPSTPTTSSPASSSNTGAIVGGILGGLVALAIAVVIFWMLCRRGRRSTLSIVRAIGKTEKQDPSELSLSTARKALPTSMALLTLQEVSDATKKFSKKIGEGAFGPVYYGKLLNGQEVALKVKKSDSHQGTTEFFSEVDLLSRIHHRNLVELVGYCEEENQQILIYVYFCNGTLSDHLYGDNPGKHLDWTTRLDIALNSAKGLDYLHTDCHPRIIHRDVKSNNILLDVNMVAKVADFGISKQAPEGIFSGVDTVLKGTIGYMDPEYFVTQRLTPKSDVYSFGVVLLEIVSGRRPHVAELPDGTTKTIIEWVRSKENDGTALMDIVDPSLNGEFMEKSMMKVLSVAIRSVDPVSANRPNMAQVVRELSEAVELELCSSVKDTDDDKYHATIHEDDREASIVNLEDLAGSTRVVVDDSPVLSFNSG